MFLVTPPKDADQIRHGAPNSALASATAPLIFPARVANKAETRARDFPKAFEQTSRLIAQALAAKSQPHPETSAACVLEQMLVLHWLDEKGWLGNGRNLWREQLQLHWEADPESCSFYASFVVPRARVLHAADILSQSLETESAFAPLADITNELSKIIFEGLILPFRYTLADITEREAETQLEPAWLSLLLAHQLASEKSATPRRATGNFVAPRRVARWVCRAALIEYLGAKLSDSTQLADQELRERLESFFALPAAASLTDLQVAELHNLFLRSEAQRMSRALLSCRVCDPSSGNGDLLVAMLEEIAAALAKLDVQLYGHEITQQHNYEFRLKRKIVNECLFGVASQPGSVRLIRQRLWLALASAEQSRPDVSLAVTVREISTALGLSQHLRCGDALLGCRAFDEVVSDEGNEAFKWRKAFPEIFSHRGGFDILLGSPSAQFTGEKRHWAQLCALFPQLKRAKNPAAAFFDLARLIGAPNAISCQVIPRPLTIAEGWAATRASLRLNYELMLATNAGEALSDARFDQEILIYRRESGLSETHHEWVAAPAPIVPLTAELAPASSEPSEDAAQAAPAESTQRAELSRLHISPIGHELLERLASLRTLSDVATLKSGQRWQRRKTKADERAAITVPVIKGTNLRQFRITDVLPRLEPPAYIQRVLEELRQPKLIVAQTCTHIKKPFDTLVLLSALDRQGSVALDSVNQIFPHADCPYSLELLAALLNSSFARWYFYFAVFNRPARAIECAPADLGRLPMPARPAAALVTQAERLVRKICKLEFPRKYLLRGQLAEFDTLDDLISELYGLNDEERAEILRLV